MLRIIALGLSLLVACSPMKQISKLEKDIAIKEQKILDIAERNALDYNLRLDSVIMKDTVIFTTKDSIQIPFTIFKFDTVARDGIISYRDTTIYRDRYVVKLERDTLSVFSTDTVTVIKEVLKYKPVNEFTIDNRNWFEKSKEFIGGLIIVLLLLIAAYIAYNYFKNKNNVQNT